MTSAIILVIVGMPIGAGVLLVIMGRDIRRGLKDWR
jgi:hypothetical protein